MPDHSDSDSSSRGEEEKRIHRAESSHPDSDPGSPSNAQQSADESGSSDGVLVELPGNPDQDSRGPRGDPDSGILVNIDGSMQEPADDPGREETFEDATDQLGVVAAQSAGLEESMAVIEIGERSGGRVVADDLAKVQAELDDTIAECRKYKEEREVFGKEVVSLRQNLRDILDRHSLLAAESDAVNLPQLETSGSEDRTLSSPTPLHAMLNDCSKSLVDLKAILDERINSENIIRELDAALNAKDKEIEDLNVNAMETSVSHDVVVSYLGSLWEIWSESKEESNSVVTKRLLESLASVVGQDHESAKYSCGDDISLVEKKTLLLIEKHYQFLSEIHKFQQCLSEVRPAFASIGDVELGNVFNIVREELFESKRKEAYFQERMGTLEEENKKLVQQVEKMRESLEAANVETNKIKAELELAENKLLAAKEKLSIAVTKGKSLVQHRDSLKQSLAEKTSELEKCMQELQQKSEALKSTEASLEELKHLLSEKTHELENCLEELQQKSDDLETARASVEDLNATYNLVSSLQESLSQRDHHLREIEEVMSQIGTPQDVLSMEVTDRVRWFVNQKNVADIIFLENRKIRDAVSSIELPEDVSPRELDSQINWLIGALTHAKDDITKLQDEINGARLAVASHESEMSEIHKEIDRLESCLLEEKLAKETLNSEYEDLRCKYEETLQKLSTLSSDKDGLMKVLLELSESTLDDQLVVDTSTIIEKCMFKIYERMQSSLTKIEHFERMQNALYLTDQELKLCEKILEDEIIDRSSMMRLSNELENLSNEVILMKTEKDSIQKELERAEEKSSLLREKLSMAVKKGKGLVQEREGFKLSLEGKVSEIEKLKQELQLKDSTNNEYQEQIKISSANTEHIEKLQIDIVSLKDERDQCQQNLDESRTMLKNLATSIEKITLPTVDVPEEPLERVNWIAEYIRGSEEAKNHALQELDRLKEEASLQAGRLADASVTIKSLEEELSNAEKQISLIVEEKSVIQLGKVSIEQELERLKDETSLQASKLSEAYATIKSLEDALVKAEKDIAQLNADKNHLEAKSKDEITELNAKLIECRKELAGTRGSIENYSAELNSQLRDLQMLIKDESMIDEQFSKMIEGLRKVNNVIQNIRDHFASKGLHVHPSMEHDLAFGKLFPLPKFEDFNNNRTIQFEEVAADNENVLSLTKIAGVLRSRVEFLSKSFEVFYRGLDEHIAVTLLALEASRDEFVRVLEHSESLKSEVHKLEAHNEAEQAKLVSLQTEMMTLFSACVDATQELVEFTDSRESAFASTFEKDAFSGEIEEEDTGRYAKAAESLLNAAMRIKNQYKKLSNAEKDWLASTDNMKNKLKEAELTAKTAVQGQMLKQERVSTLERDLEALEELCSEMKSKLEKYQAKEDVLRDKEEQLLSMQNSLDRGISGQELSESEIITLMDKVNKLEIPFDETGTQTHEVGFSSPIEKLLFIVDKFINMHQKVNILTDEKEDMQLTLASQVHEIEYLRKAAETSNINYQEFELKKNELLEMTGGLERILKSLGGYDALQDKKPLTAKLLLSVLERLTTASSLESENLKSRAQELGSKLQEKDSLIEELSEKVKILEDSIHAQSAQQEITKDLTVFEATPTAIGSEISEVEDMGPLGKNTSTTSAAAQLRTMRKGSNDHLVLNIDSESDRLIATQEADAKGHVFKSLNTSGLIPKQGKLIADRVDGIWVSGGQILMRRPGARLGLIAYLFFLHLWLIGTIL